MPKKHTFVRSYDETKSIITDMRIDLAKVERKNVSEAEWLRRTVKVPGLKEALLKDAEVKRISRIKRI